MNHVVIGGTFDNLHEGHKALIRTAFEIGDKVLVCITSDEMVKSKASCEMIESYETRAGNVKAFLQELGWSEKAEIIKLEDPFTPGLRPELTHIVVSSETRPNAEKINAMRKEKGLAKLVIVEIDWVLAKDGEPISDARVRSGEIDGEGNLL